MAKRIERQEISSDNVFGGIGESAEKNTPKVNAIMEALKLVDAELKKIREDASKVKGDFFKVDPNNAKNQKEYNAAVREADRVSKDYQRTQTTRTRLAKELTLAEAKMREQVRQANNETRQIAKLNLAANDSLDKQKALLAIVTREWDKLTVAEQENTKRGQRLKRRIDETRESVTRLEKSTGRHQRNVGNYSSALDGLNKRFVSLRNVAAQFGLALGGVALVRGAFKTISDYDEKLADIAKTSGGTREQVKRLSKELLTFNTRSTITELQELASAGGRLGISLSKIPGFVKSADQAFVALGDDLGGTAEEIATNLGKVASTFGDEQEFGIEKAIAKTGSALNELSANSKAAAGPILEFTNRLAGVASQANISQTDVQALGALFDESGQSIEVAATTLNTLLPALASDFKRFADVAGVPAEEFKKLASNSPIEALKLVAKGAQSSEKGLVGLTETLESYGVESARAASIVGILSSKTDRLSELQGIANKAFSEGTSLQNEFNTKNETVSANLEKLTKAFQVEILGIEGSTDASRKLSSILGFLANNMDTIFKTLGYVVKGLIAYKLAMTIANAQNKLAGKSLKDVLTGFKNVQKGAEGAGKSAGGFGKTLKGIGWAVAIELAWELGSAIWDVASGAAQAREDLARLQRQSEKSLKQAGKQIDQINENLKKKIDEINDSLTAGEITQVQALKRRKEANELAKQEYAQRIKTVDARKQEYKILLQQAEKANELIKAGQSDETGSAAAVKSIQRGLEELKQIQDQLQISGDKGFGFLETNAEAADIIAQLEANIRGNNDALREYYGELQNVDSELSSINAEIKGNNKSASESAGRYRKLNEELEKTDKYLSKQRELWQEIDELMRQGQIEDIQSRIDEVFSNEMKRVTETGQLDVDELERIIDEKYALEEQFIKDRQAAELEDIRIRYQAESDAEKAALEQRRVNALEKLNDRIAELKSKPSDDPAKQAEINAEISDLLANRKLIEKQYTEDIEVIRQNDLKRQSDFELEREKLQLSTNKEIRDLWSQRNDEINEKNDELIDAQVEFYTKLNKETEDGAKKSYESAKKWFELSEELFTKNIDKKIAAMDREIQARQQQQQKLSELAAQGNIDAKQSIIEQERLEAEALAKKIKLEKRKQQIQLAASTLNAFIQAKEEGKSTFEAFGAAAIDKAAISALIETLPAFFDGSENTGKHGQGIDGKGGFHAILHPEEKVFKREHAKPLIDAGLSNEEITRRALAYDIDFRASKMKPVGFENIELMNTINGLRSDVSRFEQVVKNRPVSTSEVGRILSKGIEVIDRKTKGKTTTNNIFRIS